MRRDVPTMLAALLTMILLPSVDLRVGTEILEHAGMCDASAGVAFGPTTFVVGNDEDNVLRVYLRDKPGKPVHMFDLTSFLKPDPKHPKSDIEAATRTGNRIYWIASHSRSSEGKLRPSRHRLFATEVKVTGDEVTITPVGKPYKDLVKDLAETPGLKDYNLGEAAKGPPEEVGGLNIEGLCATPQGSLLIAFRNPIPKGKALLVPLENPTEVIDGKAAKFGEPVLLSLGGRGIRSIEYCESWGKYLIVAGPRGDKGTFELYQWPGASPEATRPIGGVRFGDLRPEALIIYTGEATNIYVLSDDGTKEIHGKDCMDKRVKAEEKSFRSIRLVPFE